MSLSPEFEYRVLRLLAGNPNLSQRELARELGVSLGKTNYCLRALVDRGWLKVRNFRDSHNKAAYAYLLTPHGIEEKGRATLRFLQARLREYDQLRDEIERLRLEAAQSPDLSRTLENESLEQAARDV